MFLFQRPSATAIRRFLDGSRGLPLSYGPSGIIAQPPIGRQLDEHVVAIGHGDVDFERARAALATWKHFELGWVELFSDRPSVETGAVGAVLIRHLGFWSLNGTRVLHQVAGNDARRAFGFVYGTLTNHAESGEELFEVFIDQTTGHVMYRIRAVSWPQSALAWIGQRFVRHLQARFRHDSASVMRRFAARMSSV
jgi:uncharacterized protein (UPF0548 family)